MVCSLFFFEWEVFLNTVYEECSGVSRPSWGRRREGACAIVCDSRAEGGAGR